MATTEESLALAQARVRQLELEHEAHCEAMHKGGKAIWILLVVAFAFLVGAIAVPLVWQDQWTGPPGTWTGVLKNAELLLIVASFACVLAAGGVKVTSSDAGHMEWLGTALVAVFAGLIAISFFVRATTVDEFADYRNLVTQRPARALAAKPEIEYAFETGMLKYKIEEHFLWLVINVDYTDEHPFPRESFLFYTFNPKSGEDAKGFAEFQIPADDVSHVKRIGVFYGTGNGPSSEEFIEREDPSLKGLPLMIPGIMAPLIPST